MTENLFQISCNNRITAYDLDYNIININKIEDQLPLLIINNFSNFYPINHVVDCKTKLEYDYYKTQRLNDFIYRLHETKKHIHFNKVNPNLSKIYFNTKFPEKSAYSSDYFNLSKTLYLTKSIHNNIPVQYLNGLGFLATRNNLKVNNIQWVLMTYEDIITHNDLFTKDNIFEIPVKFLSLWYNPELHPHAKGYIKKTVIPKCNELGIKIIETDKVNDIISKNVDIPVTSLTGMQDVYRKEVYKRLCQNTLII